MSRRTERWVGQRKRRAGGRGEEGLGKRRRKEGVGGKRRSGDSGAPGAPYSYPRSFSASSCAFACSLTLARAQISTWLLSELAAPLPAVNKLWQALIEALKLACIRASSTCMADESAIPFRGHIHEPRHAPMPTRLRPGPCCSISPPGDFIINFSKQ